MTICFDGDGTLYHAETTVLELWRTFCSERNVEVSGDEMAAVLERVSAQLKERWARLIALKMASPLDAGPLEEAFWADHNAAVLSSWGMERHSGDARRRFRQATALDAVTLYGDTLPALGALREKGVAMGVYSNRPADLMPTIARLGLVGYFVWVRSAGDTGLTKPDPRVFAMAAAGLGVPLEQMVYVGNSMEEDIAGARSSGCRPVLIDRHGRRGAEPGVVVIRSLRELPKRLDL